MDDRPGGKHVPCPECNETATAIVPQESELVESAKQAEGKVWVNCHNCGERFLAYYRRDD